LLQHPTNGMPYPEVPPAPNASGLVRPQKANQLNHAPEPCYAFQVSTLAEIESAADALPPEQKQELFLFLAARLRGGAGQVPPPREFTQEQIEGWIADDEAEMRRFREER